MKEFLTFVLPLKQQGFSDIKIDISSSSCPSCNQLCENTHSSFLRVCHNILGVLASCLSSYSLDFKVNQPKFYRSCFQNFLFNEKQAAIPCQSATFQLILPQNQPKPTKTVCNLCDDYTILISDTDTALFRCFKKVLLL